MRCDRTYPEKSERTGSPFQRYGAPSRPQTQPRSALIDGAAEGLTGEAALGVQRKVRMEACSPRALIVHVQPDVRRDSKHNAAPVAGEVRRTVEAGGIDNHIRFVRTHVQIPANSNVVQLDRVFVSINVNAAGGGIQAHGRLITIDADVALERRDF